MSRVADAALIARLREWYEFRHALDTEIGGEPHRNTLLLAEAADMLEAMARIPREPTLTFTLREAVQLVATFGGDDTEVTVRKLPEGAVKDDPADPVDEGPSPAGLWAHFTEYPEEGCLYLGPCEVGDDAAAPWVEGETNEG